jgi:hypothetical protein
MGRLAGSHIRGAIVGQRRPGRVRLGKAVAGGLDELHPVSADSVDGQVLVSVAGLSVKVAGVGGTL